MIARVMRLRCAGYGAEVTSSDKRKSAVVTLAGTLVLTAVWLLADRRYDSDYVLILAPMAYTAPFFFSLRYTSLKGRSGRAQAIFIGGFIAALTVLLLFIEWASRLF